MFHSISDRTHTSISTRSLSSINEVSRGSSEPQTTRAIDDDDSHSEVSTSNIVSGVSSEF